MKIKWTLPLFASLAALSSATAQAGAAELAGYLALEARSYFQDARRPGRLEAFQPSVILSPELRCRSEDGRHQFTFAPYLRLDGRDGQRSHFDLREAYWRYAAERWEMLAGVNHVFWGVTESRHLVDIINQTDLVEDVDEEDKLGEPMFHFSRQSDWGNLGIFVLFGFRQRSFPSEKGRLRPPLPIASEALYESSAGQKHIDFALRYSHFVGDWDIGLSYFHGTSREPIFLAGSDGTELIPFYSLIDQAGIDLQYTREAWLWKLEAIFRTGQGKPFAAAVGGFEYTLYQVFGSTSDVGLLLEYLYDGRDEEAPLTAFDDDLFVATRIALNDTQDTQLLAGAVIDRSNGSTALSIEFERRIGENWKLEVESRLFVNTSPYDVLDAYSADDFTSVRLSWYF